MYRKCIAYPNLTRRRSPFGLRLDFYPLLAASAGRPLAFLTITDHVRVNPRPRHATRDLQNRVSFAYMARNRLVSRYHAARRP